MHVNYRRGETRTFVVRREHKGQTHRVVSKGKSGSSRSWKHKVNEAYRAQESQLLRKLMADPEYDFMDVEYRERVRWLSN